MLKIKLLLTVFGLLAAFLMPSQNQTKHWHFGNYAGLNFNTNPPTVITNSGLNVDEGCTSACDANGNLLFYGHGQFIVNAGNQLMAGTTNPVLSGHTSASQGALAVKQPGNSSIYYYFTLDAQNIYSTGFCYSIIDMSLAGTGSVTVKNVQLTSTCTEKLTAVKHCNGIDVWIMTHDWNSDGFRAYLLTAAGLNTTAVMSNIGQVHTGNSTMTQGCLKFSPSGNKLAMAVNGPGTYANIELYDFDRASGTVSNQLILSSSVFQPYGCEFSPDGSKLYAGGWYTPLYQWDLCAGSPAAIVASQYTAAATQLTGMQMAPDGKVYVSRAYESQLGVVNNPNLAGAACNYVNLGLSVAPKTLKFNLPNFVTSYFDQSAAPPAAPPFTSTVSCTTASFTAQLPAPVVSCTSPSYSVTNVLWDFGDPASGTANASTQLSPVHLYPYPGSYTVKLILYRCKTDTLVQVINVTQPGPALNLNGPATLCLGNAASLSVSGANTYSWSNGSANSSISVSPTLTSAYSVVGTNTTTGCQSVASITVSIVTNPTVSVTGPVSVCAGSPATLIASGANSFGWSTAATGSFITVSPINATSYTVTGTNTLGNCQASAVYFLNTLPLPSLTASGTQTICTGQSTTLTASGSANSFTWSTGSANASISISPTVSTTYTVSSFYASNGCSNSYTVDVTVFKCTGINELTGENLKYKLYYDAGENGIFIETDESIRLSLFSASGALLLDEAKYDKGKSFVDLSAYSSGVYIARSSGASGAATIKLVKTD